MKIAAAPMTTEMNGMGSGACPALSFSRTFSPPAKSRRRETAIKTHPAIIRRCAMVVVRFSVIV